MTINQIKKIAETIDVQCIEICTGESWSKTARPDAKFRIDYDLELIAIEVPNRAYNKPDDVTFINFESIIMMKGLAKSS